MMVLKKIFFCLVLASESGGFVLTTPQRGRTTRLKLTEVGIAEQAARGQAFIWIFGASGAAGIARSAFPNMVKNVQAIQDVKDKGPTEGGPLLGISPLCGYPRDLAVADVRKILENSKSIEKMVKEFPLPNNYLVINYGFLTYEAYEAANPNANPLALRAVFDCFSQGTNIVDPAVAQTKLDRYRGDLDALKFDLLKSKVIGWAAIGLLLFLLGLADIEAYQKVYAGWFPDWPGGRLWLQGGLWDPNVGVTHIPDYWI